MTLVLPPVEGAHVQTKLELKCQLAHLRLVQVDDAVAGCSVDLTKLRERNVRNDQKRHDDGVREQNRARRREAKQEAMRKAHIQATKIQALVRSFFVRRFVMPSRLEDKRKEELAKSRLALVDTMLGLHQNIHDLAFLKLDRHTASIRLQAWWRGVLGKRVVAILIIRHHIQRVAHDMAKAVTKISSIARGRQARVGCFRLRIQRKRRQQQAERAWIEKRLKAAIKIQSHIRRRMACAMTQIRRQENARAVEDAGGAASEKNDSRKRHGHGRHGMLNRKGTGPTRSEDSHHSTKHHHKESMPALSSMDGGMLIGDSDHVHMPHKPHAPVQPQKPQKKGRMSKKDSGTLH